jgi:hypothetical protein
MKNKKIFNIMMFCALMAAFIPALLEAQVCGDANGDGQQNSSDALLLINYLFGGGPPPVDYGLAETDNHELLTMADIAVIVCNLGSGDIFLPCPPENPPLDPDYSSMLEVLYPQVIPGHKEEFMIKITAFSTMEPYHLSLPLQIRIDGQIPDTDSIVFPLPESDYYGNSIYASSYDPDSGILALGISYMLFNLGYEEHAAQIYVSLTPTVNDKLVEISWAEYIPAQSVMDNGEVIPMMIGPCLNLTRRPALSGYICGDANRDGYVNVTDVIHIIRSIFYDFFAPFPIVIMDANCDGMLSVSDAMYIINYIFVPNSPAPCDC